jgi:DNA-binding NarL/FixJ family response regulator
MDSLRLLLADDHLDVLNRLSTRLSQEEGIQIVGQATNSAQAIALTLTEQPDILLIDPMMRDRLGMNALRQIANRCPATQIVVLTAIADTALQIELRRIGVEQVLIKGLQTPDLVAKLWELLQDQTAAPRKELKRDSQV